MTRGIINGILILLVFPLIIVSFILSKDFISNYFSFNDSNEALLSSLKIIALSISTILGIICGFIYQNIKIIKNKPDDKNFIYRLFNSIDLWKSLVASPIICGVVIATNRNNPDLTMAIIFAFENGFFSNLVFSFENKD